MPNTLPPEQLDGCWSESLKWELEAVSYGPFSGFVSIISPGADVATVNGFFTDAGRFSQPHALAPWDRLSVVVDERRRRRERFGRKRLMIASART
jgi:hypothetical protein